MRYRIVCVSQKITNMSEELAFFSSLRLEDTKAGVALKRRET
jgi:hypothetical protein